MYKVTKEKFKIINYKVDIVGETTSLFGVECIIYQKA